MKVGIIGLGLIGGSLAMSIRKHTEHTVFGYDIDPEVMLRARAVEAIHDALSEDMLPACDIVLVCLFPQLCADWILAHTDAFGPRALVIDCAGVKRCVCSQVEPVAARHRWTYIGGHPMAGREFSGFASARANLFENASMILCPAAEVGIERREEAKRFFLESGFKMVRFCSPEAHDQMIAYTSQLAHVVSNAYVKSPGAQCHHGFSAGSYLDLTRVARLNEVMWTELFLHNGEKLCVELDALIEHLKEYRKAIAENDAETLQRLLREGRELKEATDPDPEKC